MKKFSVLIFICVVGIGCGHNLAKYCDKAQEGYIKANAYAKALQPTIPPQVWTSCVVPLDNAANDAIVGCYRAAATGSPVEQIAAAANLATVLVSDFQILKGCGIK